MELSVVIPAYNEARRIGPTLDRIRSYLQEDLPDHEIILVDDGSMDDTVSVAQNAGGSSLRVLRNEKNLGKGAAVKKGMLEAQGDYILFTDSDLSTPIEELRAFMEKAREGWDVVIASRNAKGANKEVKQPFFRQLLGRGFPFLVRMLGLGAFSDTQCGFKLFRNEVAYKILPLQRREGFAFDVELLYLVRLKGFSLAELPVVWLDKEESKVFLLRDGWKMVGDLLRIRFDQWSGKYGKKNP